eukprot:TRINITY_DN2766_c0_g1_i1.p1 TRINITY_DN2766_c0_g1~~TRINITY_DN2766_c0_g1_i1.p1  ORF type:complete len:201 (-),score=60.12 TRINITY_DN2766_c0_g1_i1:18-620(-)
MSSSRMMSRGASKWSRKTAKDKLPKPQDVVTARWNIVRGDTVEVISGKHKRAQGVVTKVFRRENRVLVRGVNVVKKRVPPQQIPAGGEPQLVSKEAPLPYSSLALVDPTTKKACRVKWIDTPEGKVRVSAESGTIIERPIVLTRLRKKAVETPGIDTPPAVVSKQTFQASTLIPWLNTPAAESLAADELASSEHRESSDL